MKCGKKACNDEATMGRLCTYHGERREQSRKATLARKRQQQLDNKANGNGGKNRASSQDVKRLKPSGGWRERMTEVIEIAVKESQELVQHEQKEVHDKQTTTLVADEYDWRIAKRAVEIALLRYPEQFQQQSQSSQPSQLTPSPSGPSSSSSSSSTITTTIITATETGTSPSQPTEDSSYWTRFFEVNTSNFFKLRQWVSDEFWLLAPERVRGPLRVLDCGCGTGCTLLPLRDKLRASQSVIFGFDFASSAVACARVLAKQQRLDWDEKEQDTKQKHAGNEENINKEEMKELLTNNELNRSIAYLNDVITHDNHDTDNHAQYEEGLFVSDLTISRSSSTNLPNSDSDPSHQESPLFGALKGCFDVVTAMFTLSAISPRLGQQQSAWYQLYSALTPGGFACIRDYALYDMTHLRFIVKGGRKVHGVENLYRREGDNTLALFFTQRSVREFAETAGFRVVLNELVTTRLMNRSSNIPQYRVFVQAILYKPFPDRNGAYESPQSRMGHVTEVQSSRECEQDSDVKQRIINNPSNPGGSADHGSSSSSSSSLETDAEWWLNEPPVLNGRVQVKWSELCVRRPLSESATAVHSV